MGVGKEAPLTKQSRAPRRRGQVTGLRRNVIGPPRPRKGVNLAAHRVGAGCRQLLKAGGVRGRSRLPDGLGWRRWESRSEGGHRMSGLGSRVGPRPCEA
jgi:hypothetical protein